MRIDKFLKVSRILKRRSVAASACTGGHTTINGKAAKPGNRLKIGDVVSVTLGTGSITFKVLALNEKANKEQAASLYEIINE